MPLFFAKFLLIIIICALNIGIIFFSKSRLNSLIILVISCLLTILFLSITISDFNGFKEICLALIIFLAVILSLISSNNEVYLKEELTEKRIILSLKFIIFLLVTLFCAYKIFQISNQVNKTATLTQEIIRQKNEITNQSPINENSQNVEYRSKYQLEKLQTELQENPFLKRSTDLIFLIVATTSCVLLFQRKRT